MRPRFLRSALGSALAAALLLLPDAASSRCDPLSAQCPPVKALGGTCNVDFRKGAAADSFNASGTPSYGGDGVSFSVARGGDAPQLNSKFYIMFGYVELTAKAAPGAGIVSSLVLMSDDRDEIDIEWLGSSPDEMQSNYFGKGRTTNYNRGMFHAVRATQDRWITYAINWSADGIDWLADGVKLRSLSQADADADQYPQTPMRIQFGAWAAGDPAHNEPGTVDWAHGPTDYSRGPFAMHVQSLRVVDYSTGKRYRYLDQSGSWEKIEAIDGAVNGNKDSAVVVPGGAPVGAAPPSRSGGAGAVPPGGIARDGSPAARTQTGYPWVPGASPTGGTIPSGWHMTSDGKIVRDSSSGSPAAVRASLPLLLVAALLTPLACRAVLALPGALR
ncbi:glycosyl hydrolases family 16 domain-containing protein [Hirsutella rhossiliensis]|uniref:Glycosyl hydrolases family 16 domain-containing protein n=1 Tax=Hirsutella rhossiliensis TaxID=111463 RepID=A0A9P8MY62_9HYPO|nr:glycosyl hydrolases family 16 domain-containing protein [Hirsutella rhossiliensis]KAH0963127.1 glycosyl hydrolases family 16 domain-containing protein [Hirsutella rhossiliensis]